MNRIRLALATIVILLAGVFVAPAQAGSLQIKSVCTSDEYTCMTVTFSHDTATQGISVWQVIGNCTLGGNGPAFGWDSPADDGHSMDLVNNTTGVTYWSLGEGTNTYVVNGNCQNSWNVNIDKPNSHQVTLTWHFTEQFNLQPDSNKTLSITIYNN